MRAGIAIGCGAALLIALAMAPVIHGQAPTDAELRRLTEAYAQAWAKGDAKALAGLHTTEALRIGADGRVAVGRAAIQQAFSEALAGPYRGTKIILTVGQSARAAQDVYVSEGTFQISGGLPPAGMPTRGRYLQTLVRLSGRWLIAGDAPVSAPRPPK
ncbi:MAG TPA: SgcJ/EcaC family oxidoreductase [Vicinamibacterales bacterium]|jgi:uncharacterized protein (TIGR02246 family)